MKKIRLFSIACCISLMCSCKAGTELKPLLDAAADLESPEIVYLLDASCSVCVGDCVDFVKSLHSCSNLPLTVVCQAEHLDLADYYLSKAFPGNKLPEIVSSENIAPFNMISANNVYLLDNGKVINYFYYTSNSLNKLSGEFYRVQ